MTDYSDAFGGFQATAFGSDSGIIQGNHGGVYAPQGSNSMVAGATSKSSDGSLITSLGGNEFSRDLKQEIFNTPLAKSLTEQVKLFVDRLYTPSNSGVLYVGDSADGKMEKMLNEVLKEVDIRKFIESNKTNIISHGNLLVGVKLMNKPKSRFKSKNKKDDKNDTADKEKVLRYVEYVRADTGVECRKSNGEISHFLDIQNEDNDFKSMGVHNVLFKNSSVQVGLEVSEKTHYIADKTFYKGVGIFEGVMPLMILYWVVDTLSSVLLMKSAQQKRVLVAPFDAGTKDSEALEVTSVIETLLNTESNLMAGSANLKELSNSIMNLASETFRVIPSTGSETNLEALHESSAEDLLSSINDHREDLHERIMELSGLTSLSTDDTFTAAEVLSKDMRVKGLMKSIGLSLEIFLQDVLEVCMDLKYPDVEFDKSLVRGQFMQSGLVSDALIESDLQVTKDEMDIASDVIGLVSDMNDYEGINKQAIRDIAIKRLTQTSGEWGEVFLPFDELESDDGDGDSGGGNKKRKKGGRR